MFSSMPQRYLKLCIE